jgi:hypothetical protein
MGKLSIIYRKISELNSALLPKLSTLHHAFGRVRGNAFRGLLSARRRAKESDCRSRPIMQAHSAFRIRKFLLLTVRAERDDHFRRYDIASEVCLPGSPLICSIDDEKSGTVRRVKP